jgi:hypothetical protein
MLRISRGRQRVRFSAGFAPKPALWLSFRNFAQSLDRVSWVRAHAAKHLDYTHHDRGQNSSPPSPQYAIGSLEWQRQRPEENDHDATCQAGSTECAARRAFFSCRPCAKLRSGNHKTAFAAKPPENLTFPQKMRSLDRNSPRAVSCAHRAPRGEVQMACGQQLG